MKVQQGNNNWLYVQNLENLFNFGFIKFCYAKIYSE
jgi:hypothetical protein